MYADYLNNNDDPWACSTDAASNIYFEELSESDPNYFGVGGCPISRVKYDPDHIIAMSSQLITSHSQMRGMTNFVYIDFIEVTRFSGPIKIAKKTFKKTNIFEFRFNDGKLVGASIFS